MTADDCRWVQASTGKCWKGLWHLSLICCCWEMDECHCCIDMYECRRLQARAPVMYYVSILMVGDRRWAYVSLNVGRCCESALSQTYRRQYHHQAKWNENTTTRWWETTGGEEERRQSEGKKAQEMSNNISWAIGKFLFVLFSCFLLLNFFRYLLEWQSWPSTHPHCCKQLLVGW